MEYVKLGGSPLTVSRLGFGCDPIGGHAWGEVDADEARRAIAAAVDSGITLFDTADCYGRGDSERLLGEALRSRRDEVVIASKFGVRTGAGGGTVYDNSPAWLDTALDASLDRLGVERIDLYQVHYWDRQTPVAEIFDRLERKRADGKIGFYGVTNMNLTHFALEDLPPGLVSFSFEYSLADCRHADTIVKMSKFLGLTFLSWGSLGQGILTGKYHRDNLPGEGDRRSRPAYRNFHGAGLDRNLEIVDALRDCGGRAGGRSPSQVAMRWILDGVANSVVLAGIKTRAQLEDNLGATGWLMDDADFETLNRLSRPKQLVDG